MTCTPHACSMFMYSTNTYVHTYVLTLMYSTITYIMYSHLLQSCGVPSASGKAKPGVHYRLNARDIPFILGTVNYLSPSLSPSANLFLTLSTSAQCIPKAGYNYFMYISINVHASHISCADVLVLVHSICTYIHTLNTVMPTCTYVC